MQQLLSSLPTLLLNRGYKVWNIDAVFYVLLWIKYGVMRSANHCIVFFLTFETPSSCFWNRTHGSHHYQHKPVNTLLSVEGPIYIDAHSRRRFPGTLYLQQSKKGKKTKTKIQKSVSWQFIQCKKKKKSALFISFKKKRILCFEGRIIYFLQFQIKNNFLLLLNGFP